jgi:hypothetical protein
MSDLAEKIPQQVAMNGYAVETCDALDRVLIFYLRKEVVEAQIC